MKKILLFVLLFAMMMVSPITVFADDEGDYGGPKTPTPVEQLN